MQQFAESLWLCRSCHSAVLQLYIRLGGKWQIACDSMCIKQRCHYTCIRQWPVLQAFRVFSLTASRMSHRHLRMMIILLVVVVCEQFLRKKCLICSVYSIHLSWTAMFNFLVTEKQSQLRHAVVPTLDTFWLCKLIHLVCIQQGTWKKGMVNSPQVQGTSGRFCPHFVSCLQLDRERCWVTILPMCHRIWLSVKSQTNISVSIHLDVQKWPIGLSLSDYTPELLCDSLWLASYLSATKLWRLFSCR